MNKGIIYWLRWSAVLPCAFLAAIFTSVLIRTVLFYTVFLFFPPNNIAEVMLTPVLNAAGFVFFGSIIAPERNKKSLAILFVLCMAVIGIFVFLDLTGAGWNGYKFQFRNGVTTCLMGILGACVGMSLVKGRIKRQQSR
ncbi:hypothetical protein OCK74_20065 [Chitinophagaceae bacterium LB-8]|uniref:Uncharacterized protein n=1 Tax=Paraflavisolibacter caeni TaxID=2982496 RepID=A0A9X2XPP4_9BACT|nr:hypothetical protein [Paraflavisolibacter caeni]MCU7551429.1 hypothetical protein [Paraflavisolibacter caeni]